MRLLLTTQTSGGDGANEGCEYVLLNFSKALREKLLALKAKAKVAYADENFYCVEFFDYSPVPVSAQASLVEADWLGSVSAVPKGVRIRSSAFRIEASTVRLDSYGVRWAFFEKHCRAEIETPTIRWKQITGEETL